MRASWSWPGLALIIFVMAIVGKGLFFVSDVHLPSVRSGGPNLMMGACICISSLAITSYYLK